VEVGLRRNTTTRMWAPSQGQPAGARSLCMHRSDDGSQQRPVTPNCISLRILPGQRRTSPMSVDHPEPAGVRRLAGRPGRFGVHPDPGARPGASAPLGQWEPADSATSPHPFHAKYPTRWVT